MKAIPFILPPLPEQTAIANFLDDKCAEIDRAIVQKEKLIALLKERKQIVIQNAVTGKTVWSEKEQAFVPLSLSGVEGKDSGVDWIGEVPVGWEVKRAKYLFKEVDERSKTGTEELFSLRMHIGLIPHNEVSDIKITAEQLKGYKIARRTVAKYREQLNIPVARLRKEL